MPKLLFLAIIFTCVVTNSCRKAAPPDTTRGMPSPSDPRATIWVGSDGTIELNGQVADLTAVDKALSALVTRKGAVMYGRDAATGEPPQNAMKVIQLVIKHHLPIRMSTKRDFSDVVDANGQVVP